MVFGLLELYEAGFDEKYLQTSIDLTKSMIAQFWDEKNGGFYLSGKNGDESVPKLKQTYDGAAPSGNSVALYNLLRLARLSGDNSFEDYASQLIKTFSEEIKEQPLGHTFLLVGLEFALGPTFNVVLVGDPKEKDAAEMLAALRKSYLPNLTVNVWTAEKAKSAGLGTIYEKIEDKATVYVCRDQTCMPPTNKVEKMLEYLKS